VRGGGQDGFTRMMGARWTGVREGLDYRGEVMGGAATLYSKLSMRERIEMTPATTSRCSSWPWFASALAILLISARFAPATASGLPVVEF